MMILVLLPMTKELMRWWRWRIAVVSGMLIAVLMLMGIAVLEMMMMCMH
jgi:hypothetical protein